MDARFDTIVAGAGLAGTLSTFWLSMHQNVLLLEASAKPAGASHVAAGIVNPFAGLRGRLIWRGLTALDSIDALLAEAGAEACYHRCGVLRPAASQEQADSFRTIAHSYPAHATWREASAAEERFPPVIARHGALQLRCGGIMNTTDLIEAALRSAASRGATIMTGAPVTSWGPTANGAFVETRDGRRYDASRVLLCLGNGYVKFTRLRTLKLHRTKGQILRVARPPGYAIPMPISQRGYIVPTPAGLLVGTTYEHNFTSETPTTEASRIILLNASAMVPSIGTQPPLAATAGIRVGVPGTRLPMVGEIAPHVWIFTGLGSKGLLFSALLSRELFGYFEDRTHVPFEIRVVYANSNLLSR